MTIFDKLEKMKRKSFDIATLEERNYRGQARCKIIRSKNLDTIVSR